MDNIDSEIRMKPIALAEKTIYSKVQRGMMCMKKRITIKIMRSGRIQYKSGNITITSENRILKEGWGRYYKGVKIILKNYKQIDEETLMTSCIKAVVRAAEDLYVLNPSRGRLSDEIKSGVYYYLGKKAIEEPTEISASAKRRWLYFLPG